jgi:hypothetical protein
MEIHCADHMTPSIRKSWLYPHWQATVTRRLRPWSYSYIVMCERGGENIWVVGCLLVTINKLLALNTPTADYLNINVGFMNVFPFVHVTSSLNILLCNENVSSIVLYCRVMHPVARTINVVRRNHLSQQLYKICYSFIIIATCFGLFHGHPQAILTILNIKKSLFLQRIRCEQYMSNCIYYRQMLPSFMFHINFDLSVKLLLKYVNV